MISKSSGFIVAAATGLLCAAINVLIIMVGDGNNQGNLIVLMMGVALGALGGVFSKFDSRNNL